MPALRRAGDGGRDVIRRAAAADRERAAEGGAGPGVGAGGEVPGAADHADGAVGAGAAELVAGPAGGGRGQCVRGGRGGAAWSRGQCGGAGDGGGAERGGRGDEAGRADGGGEADGGGAGGDGDGGAGADGAGGGAAVGGRARGRGPGGDGDGDGGGDEGAAELRRVPAAVPAGDRDAAAGAEDGGDARDGAGDDERGEFGGDADGRDAVDGHVPVHGVAGADGGRAVDGRDGEPERRAAADVRGAAGAVAAGADAGDLLSAVLQAACGGGVGGGGRVGGLAAGQPAAVADAVPAAAVGRGDPGHAERVREGDVRGAHGVRRPRGAPDVPRAGEYGDGVRGAAVGGDAAAAVRAAGEPAGVEHRVAGPGRGAVGVGAAEHAEAGAADDEQLLRGGERVDGAHVDDAVGERRRRRAGDDEEERGQPGGAARDRAERGDVDVAAGGAGAGVPVSARRAAAVGVGHIVERGDGDGDGAHREGAGPGEQRVAAAGERDELVAEQHADPAGELHGRVGVAGDLRAGGHPGDEPGAAGRGPGVRGAAAVGVRDPAGRAGGGRGRGREWGGRRAGRVAADGGVPDPGVEHPVGAAVAGERGDGEQPDLVHGAADQGGAAGGRCVDLMRRCRDYCVSESGVISWQDATYLWALITEWRNLIELRKLHIFLGKVGGCGLGFEEPSRSCVISH